MFQPSYKVAFHLLFFVTEYSFYICLYFYPALNHFAVYFKLLYNILTEKCKFRRINNAVNSITNQRTAKGMSMTNAMQEVPCPEEKPGPHTS